MDLDNSMDLDDPVPVFKVIISCEEALSFHKDHKNLKGVSFAEELLSKSGLSIAPITTENLEQQYRLLKDTVRIRWGQFYVKWKKNNYRWKSFDGKPEDTFIDLSSDFPDLINYEDVVLLGSQVRYRNSQKHESTLLHTY